MGGPFPDRESGGAYGDALEVAVPLALGHHGGIIGEGDVDDPAVGWIHGHQGAGTATLAHLVGDSLRQAAQALLAYLMEVVAVDAAESGCTGEAADDARQEMLDRHQHLAV